MKKCNFSLKTLAICSALGLTFSACERENIGKTLTVNVNGAEFEMVLIKSGSFKMGSDLKNDSTNFLDDEAPKHDVKITRNFYMMRTECTQKVWKAVMGDNPSHYQTEKNGISKSTVTDNFPVESVSWEDVNNVFIPKLNELTGKKFRLPTEAEWEYACRAGNNGDYYFGNDTSELVKHAWMKDNANAICEVATKGYNAWGLYDMHGNVSEWVSDFYEVYSADNNTDPEGPESGMRKILRGGNFTSDFVTCRASYRKPEAPIAKNSTTGFRLVFLEK